MSRKKKISQCYKNCQKVKKYFEQFNSLAAAAGPSSSSGVEVNEVDNENEEDKDAAPVAAAQPRLNFSGIFSSSSSRSPPGKEGTPPPPVSSTSDCPPSPIASSKSSSSLSTLTPCQDISNVVHHPGSSKVWGTHVQSQPKKARNAAASSGSKDLGGAKGSKEKKGLAAAAANAAAPPTRTRSTLKKKKRPPPVGGAGSSSLLRANSVTFDTLGLDENSQDSAFSPPSSTGAAMSKAKSDPLARFDPAISNLDTSDAFLLTDSIASADLSPGPHLSADSAFASLDSPALTPFRMFSDGGSVSKPLPSQDKKTPVAAGTKAVSFLSSMGGGASGSKSGTSAAVGSGRKVDRDWLKRCGGGGGSSSVPEDAGTGQHTETEISISPQSECSSERKRPRDEEDEDTRDEVKALKKESFNSCKKAKVVGAPGDSNDSSSQDVFGDSPAGKPKLTFSRVEGLSRSQSRPLIHEPAKASSSHAPPSDHEDEDSQYVDLSDHEGDYMQEVKTSKKSRTKVAAKKGGTKPGGKKAASAAEEPATAAASDPNEPSKINVYSLGFEEPEEGEAAAKKLKAKAKFSKFKSKGELLKKKVENGTANENYVKIDIKKKTFVRGRKTMTGGKYRRMEWKRKMAEKEGTKIKEKTCFKCGEEGHWATDCFGASDKLMPKQVDENGMEMDESEFPTLEEAADMARGVSAGGDNSRTTVHLYKALEKEEGTNDVVSEDKDIFDDGDNDLLLQALAQWQPEEEQNEDVDALRKLKPYFRSNQSDDECKQILKETLAKFGYESFRPGQEEAILRILRGDSTLVLLATGSGKSLIYQIPAFLYGERERCLTIVVSPLVSLMEDQVVGLPPFLKAACLHANQTKIMREKVAYQIKEGKLHFLLVSPESLASGGGIFASLIKDLPPISFVCIDEAHCVSQWSHNFRPAYLRLSKIIRERLGVKTVLGLTATAPESTIQDIATHLEICEKSGIIRGPLLPKNLILSVSKDENRDYALMKLLQGDRWENCDSIIIYCTRREECVRLATMIRTHLQENDLHNEGRIKGKKKMSFTAEPYHAGLTPARRRSVQNYFMSGKLRIVVATVAFGMGIDKSDIRSVIHYNMPKTFESYIQEIGRAGRDGLEAHCHLFLNSEGQDINELRRHIYGNSLDGHTIRKFLDIVFDGSKDADSVAGSKYKEVAASIEDTIEALDLAEENISTLLCYLEQDERKWINIQNPVYSLCKIRCYNGPKQLKALAKKSPPVAAAIAVARKKGGEFEKTAQIEFPVVEVSATMGWDSGTVKRELKNLQWTQALGGRWQKSGVLVEMSNLAFHFEALKGLSVEDRDNLKNFLHTRVVNQEKAELHSLARIFRSFSTVSHSSIKDCADEADMARSEKLKHFITEYFSETERDLGEDVKSSAGPLENESQIRGDIRQFVCSNPEHNWTGRAVARVFHGITSPNFPAKQWGRVRRYWRSHLDVDFNLLCKLATQIVVSLRTGQ